MTDHSDRVLKIGHPERRKKLLKMVSFVEEAFHRLDILLAMWVILEVLFDSFYGNYINDERKKEILLVAIFYFRINAFLIWIFLFEVIIIRQLTRPFTVKQLQQLLSKFGQIAENGFWIDNIKSMCIVKVYLNLLLLLCYLKSFLVYFLFLKNGSIDFLLSFMFTFPFTLIHLCTDLIYKTQSILCFSVVFSYILSFSVFKCWRSCYC